MGSASLSKTLLVTGASGFLGRALVRHLSRAGWQVRALVRDLTHAPGLKALGATDVFHADLPQAIDPAAFAPEQGTAPGALIHCAYDTRAVPAASARSHIEGTRRLLGLARERKIGKSVFI